MTSPSRGRQYHMPAGALRRACLWRRRVRLLHRPELRSKLMHEVTRGSWTNLVAVARLGRRQLTTAMVVVSAGMSPFSLARGQTPATGTKIPTDLLMRVLEYRL